MLNFHFFVRGADAYRYGTQSDDRIINCHPFRAIRHKDGDSVTAANTLVSQIKGDLLCGGFKTAVGILILAACQGDLVLKMQRAVIDDAGKIQDNFLDMENRYGFAVRMN
jgi:hypothetical protein